MTEGDRDDEHDVTPVVGTDESTLESERDGPVGRTLWALSGGFVPTESTGPEPEMVGHETLCLLNAGDEMASVDVTFHYEDGRTAGPYVLTVAPERVRHVRTNDLIDPYAPPLGRAYGTVVESDVPIVVQATRLDSRQTENATLSTVAYADPDEPDGS